jgi:TP901 family phage tail tape measure protein
MADLSLRYLLFGEDRTASSSMKGVGKAADDVGTRVSNSAKKIGEGVAVAVAATVALSVHNAMAMQESDAKIQGSAQITAAAAKSIGDAFLSTAGKSTFSGKEMADSFGPVAGVIQEVAGHTLTAADSMTVMNAATTLAEATGNALGATTGDLAAVMQSYGIKIGGAAAASNILFNASRLTNVPLDTLATTVDKLHGKLGIAAPTLTDVSGLMVDLANHGIAGSRGLMVVNTGLTTLMGGSKATTAELKDLGIHIFDSSGKFVGMGAVLSQLTPKLRDMTQQQQLAAEKALFGAGAAKALNSTLLAGVTGFTNSTKAVTLHNAAEDAAKAKAATLQGQIKILTAAFMDITTELGQKLIPVVEIGVTWLDKNRLAAYVLAGIVGGVLLAATIAWTASMVTAAAATIAATWPVIAIIAVIAALALGLVYCWNHFSTFRAVVTDTWHAIASGTTWLWGSVLKPTFIWMANAFMTFASVVLHGAAWAFGWIPGIGPKLRTAAAHFDQFKNNVMNSINGINGRSVTVGVNFSSSSQAVAHPAGSAGQSGQVVKGMRFGAVGGKVNGSGFMDSEPYMLMPGEFIVRRDGSNLGDAFKHYGARGMAGGGLVVNASIPSAAQIGSAVNSGMTGLVGAQDFMSMLAASSGGSGGGGGAAQWASVILAVLAALGQSANNLGALERRINFESGGNPNAINLTDSNAMAGHPSQGLMQTIPGTFMAYAGPYASLGITNPFASIYAGAAYAIANYGSIAAIDPLVRPMGYDQGGDLYPGTHLVHNGTGQIETIRPHGAGATDGPLTINLIVNGSRLASAVLPDLQRMKGAGVRVNLG